MRMGESRVIIPGICLCRMAGSRMNCGLERCRGDRRAARHDRPGGTWGIDSRAAERGYASGAGSTSRENGAVSVDCCGRCGETSQNGNKNGWHLFKNGQHPAGFRSDQHLHSFGACIWDYTFAAAGSGPSIGWSVGSCRLSSGRREAQAGTTPPFELDPYGMPVAGRPSLSSLDMSAQARLREPERGGRSPESIVRCGDRSAQVGPRRI